MLKGMSPFSELLNLKANVNYHQVRNFNIFILKRGWGDSQSDPRISFKELLYYDFEIKETV
jgi:hypothetical protein